MKPFRAANFAAAVVLTSLTLAASCGRKQQQAAPAANAADTDTIVSIAYVPAIDALPFFVAAKRGLFESEGLAVNLARFSSHLDIDTALIGGSVDGAFSDIIRVEQLKKKDSLALRVITSTEAQWTLVSNRAARLNRLQQFGDKMVAMTRFSATDYLTDRTFAGVKTAAPMFKVQINNIELRLNMLLNNEMDGLWLPEPYAARALIAGHKPLVSSEKYGLKFGVLVLRQAFVNKPGGEATAAKLAKIYSMACDTINKYGLRAFDAELTEYCGADSAVIRRLPDIHFAHAKAPGDTLRAIARKYLEE
ncbi:MAG: ABC transporter substrate-binding protein [Prevotella sp.]|nr:ABC transporter substrate-binding protein [Prevotella sp.]